MKSHFIYAPQPCPSCGVLSDSVTGVNSPEAPVEGNIKICVYCNHTSVFTGQGFTSREPTEVEWTEIMADPNLRQMWRSLEVRRRRTTP